MNDFDTIAVNLSTEQINFVLPKVKVGLNKYLDIQTRLNSLVGKPLSVDTEFRKRFNGFYRIRQKPTTWYDTFYKLLDESRGSSVGFSDILHTLHQETGRYEASFSSKLLATLNPEMPVIDSIVLAHLKVKLPYTYDLNRLEKICQLHESMQLCYATFLKTEEGSHLVRQFKHQYPYAEITEVKMLDLVLWQLR
jgi:hypothetical protein